MTLEISINDSIAVQERIGGLYIVEIYVGQSIIIAEEEPAPAVEQKTDNRGPPTLAISVNDESKTNEAFGE
jgi:hypothetical protein